MSEPPNIAQSTDEHAVGRTVPKYAARVRHKDDGTARSPHARRFRTATAILTGLGVAAIIIAVALVIAGNNSQRDTPQAWSSWSPPDSGTLGATEIAAHVAPFYRLSSINQLDVVTVVNLESAAAASAQAQAEANGTTLPPSSGLQVAVRPNPQSSAVSLLSGNTIAYNLCGIGGRNCAISVGTPSSNRLLLLRREALELALYTFKYIAGAQTVVAILPPGYTTQHCVGAACAKSQQKSVTKPLDLALLFARGELAPWLQRPLRSTFPESIPPTVSQIAKSPEAEIVSLITAHGMFAESTASAQDGSTVISLNGPIQPQ